MALNFFYSKKSRTDGTYKKYLENEIEGKIKSNENIRKRIKEFEAEIIKNEEEIQKLNKEYRQVGGRTSYEPPKPNEANTTGYTPATPKGKEQDQKTKDANYGIVLIIGIITLFFAAVIGIPAFAGFVLCAIGVFIAVMLFR